MKRNRHSGRGMGDSRGMRRLAAIACLFVLMPLAACTGWDGPGVKAETDAASARIAQLEADLSAVRASAAARIAKAETDAAAAKSQAERDAAALAKSHAERDAAAAAESSAVVADAKRAVDAVNASLNADGSINPAGLAASAGAVIGGPWGPIVTAGLPLLWGVIERTRRRSALKSVAVALDKVSVKNPQLSAGLDAEWSNVEAHLTPAARAAFNEHSVT